MVCRCLDFIRFPDNGDYNLEIDLKDSLKLSKNSTPGLEALREIKVARRSVTVRYVDDNAGIQISNIVYDATGDKEIVFEEEGASSYNLNRVFFSKPFNKRKALLYYNIDIKATFEGSSPSNFNPIGGSSKYECNYKITYQNPEIDINFKELMPAISAIDLVKEYVWQNSLLMHINPDTKQCRFTEIDKIFTNTNKAKDWSDKLIQIDEETYREPKYYDKNYGQYADNDKQLLYSLHDHPLKTTGTIHKSCFVNPENTPNTDWLTQYDFVIHELYDIKHYKDSNQIKSVKARTAPTRIFSLSTIPYHEEFEAFNGEHSMFTSSNMPCLSTKKTKLQYFINKNHKAVIRTLKRLVIVKAKLILNSEDLDNTDLIYLKQTGRYYYLRKIINYNFRTKYAQCELLTIYPEAQDTGNNWMDIVETYGDDNIR